MRRDVFQAIADPTRRAIINLIAHRSLNVNAVSDHFSISRPAISKHMKILRECGLVVIRPEGRERYCDVQLHKLKEVVNWAETYKAFWSKKMESLGDFLEKEKRQRKKAQTKKK
jgi:DNA-binding transcriptional ArsR family regulator